MSKQPSLKRNALALLSMQGINYLIPLIVLPYLTRTLGTDQYGALNLALSLVQYGALFIIFGFNLSATQYVAKNRNHPLLISRAFWETMIAKFILLIIACITLSLITISVSNFQPISILVFILFIQLLSIAIDPLWFFQGIEKLEVISIIGSLIRLLTIPLLIYFVHSPEDVGIAALIQSTILLITAVINLSILKKTNIISLIKYSQLRILQALKTSFPFFIGAAAISLYNTSTPIILGLVSNYDEVGIYAASFRVQVAAIGVFTVLGQVLFPRANHLFAISPAQGYLFIRKLLFWMMPILIISWLLFFLIVPTIAPWILGQEFNQSSTSLMIMSPMLILTPFCIVFAHNILLPLGFVRIYYIVPLVIGLTHIVYSIILSTEYGAIGASVSILITECLSFITLLACVLIYTDFKSYLLKRTQ